MANTLNLGNGNWAAKEGSLLAYNDENGNFKPLPFDFTRASSATRVNSQGLIEVVGSDQPRVDYSSGEGALLLEPQRSNLITYSEDFTSGWALDDATLISNSVVSPYGTQNAATLIGNTVNSRHHIRRGILGSVDASYSFFAKYKELRYLQIASVNSTNQYANFDIKNGVIGLVGTDFSDAKIEDYGNGWYRCSVVSINEYNAFYLSLVSGLNATWLESWVMPNNTDGLYIWGAQIEEGSYATSYIPTQGAAVTRVQDACNNGGNEQVINSTEGVLYFEGSSSGSVSDGYISISDGTTSNRLALRIAYNNVNKVSLLLVSAGSFQFEEFYDASPNDFKGVNKFALKYKANNFALWLNGLEVLSISSGLITGTYSVLNFANSNGTSQLFYGNCKDLRLYNTALTDAELQALTTI